MHNRSHLCCWSLAEVPWSLGQHFKQLIPHVSFCALCTFIFSCTVLCPHLVHHFNFRATNAENGELNKIKNQMTGNYGGVSEVARAYKAKGVKWVAIGDENYGKELILICISTVLWVLYLGVIYNFLVFLQTR